MPITYRYDPSANRLCTRCEGMVVLSDVLDHFDRLRCDSRVKPRCDVMLDLSFQTRVPNLDQIDRVATCIESSSDLVSFGRCAVVAAEDVAYDLARTFQALAWPSFTGMRVFRSEAEAIGWLNEDAAHVG